jgi:hypothetical protein
MEIAHVEIPKSNSLIILPESRRLRTSAPRDPVLLLLRPGSTSAPVLPRPAHPTDRARGGAKTHTTAIVNFNEGHETKARGPESAYQNFIQAFVLSVYP